MKTIHHHRFLFYHLLLCLFFIPAAPVAGMDLEFTDSDGVLHRLSKPVERIISLYPAHTENLVEIGAADKLIGISTSDTYPESILDKKTFSYHDSLEKFIEADPDCILIRPMIARAKPDLIKKLRDYGIRVISLQPTSITEVYEYWHTLGAVTDNPGGAETMISSFKSELEAIRQRLSMIPPGSRPQVYFESIHARMRTFSPDSIAIFCLDAAGGINIAEDAVARRGTNIAGYSKERILAKGSDIDVFLAQSGRMNRVTIAEIKNEPGFKAIKAVREGRIHLIDEHLVARPTTRLLQGITTIQGYLYPEQPQLVTSP